MKPAYLNALHMDYARHVLLSLQNAARPIASSWPRLDGRARRKRRNTQKLLTANDWPQLLCVWKIRMRTWIVPPNCPTVKCPEFPNGYIGYDRTTRTAIP